jgi:hypothetical protein
VANKVKVLFPEVAYAAKTIWRELKIEAARPIKERGVDSACIRPAAMSANQCR